jgi:ABC-type sugar transport system permease subunit
VDPSSSLTGAAALPAAPRTRSLRRARETVQSYAFLAPALVLLGVFLVGPAIWVIGLSLYKWNLISADPEFIGLKNYEILLTRDKIFRQAVFQTFYYVFVSVPLGLALGLFFAVMLNAKIRGRGFMRGAFFSPHIMPFVATVIVWMWIFNPEYGILNAALRAIHLPRVNWLGDPRTWMPSFILYALWQHVGYNTVIFLAGLANLPVDVDEAAHVDGANAWQTFWQIKWPMLTPTTYLVLLINMIGAFKVAQQILVFTNGLNGPNNAAETIGLYLYQQAFANFRAGYAGAISVILFVIIVLISLVQVRFLSRRVFYQ